MKRIISSFQWPSMARHGTWHAHKLSAPTGPSLGRRLWLSLAPILDWGMSTSLSEVSSLVAWDVITTCIGIEHQHTYSVLCCSCICGTKAALWKFEVISTCKELAKVQFMYHFCIENVSTFLLCNLLQTTQWRCPRFHCAWNLKTEAGCLLQAHIDGFQSHTARYFANVYCLTASVDLKCRSSSGHCTRTWMHKETECHEAGDFLSAIDGARPVLFPLGDYFYAVSSSLILVWPLWVRIPESLPTKVVNCVVLCIVCVYMCTVLLLPGVNPIAVNKYINIGDLSPMR